MKTQTVIYRHKAKSVVCFREAANIIKVIKQHNSEVELIRGSKTGTAASILSIVYLSSLIIGPWAILAGMIGEGLADVAGSYVIYAPATVVIKAIGPDAEETVQALVKII